MDKAKDDIRVLGLSFIYQRVCLDEFGEWKYVLGKDRSMEAKRKSKYYPTFLKLWHILKENKLDPEVYMRAIARWVKRSKRFPTLYPSLLTGKTMLEVVKSHLRKEHMKANQDRKAASKSLKRTRGDEILSEVRHSCEVVRRATRSFAFSKKQVFEAFRQSLSLHYLLTEDEYLDMVESLTEREKKVAKELINNGMLLESILKVKEPLETDG